LHYGIIFSIDTAKDDIDDAVYQPVPDDVWTKTEDCETELPCWEDEDTEDALGNKVPGGWHYKWCACLDQEQMDEFMEKMMFTSMCDTMGSMGAPQPDGDIYLGISPAFALDCEDQHALINAYVTPYIMDGDEDLIPAI
jgi:hypothetical protein